MTIERNYTGASWLRDIHASHVRDNLAREGMAAVERRLEITISVPKVAWGRDVQMQEE